MTTPIDALKPENCINTVCPWSGEGVQPDSLTLYRGRVVGFCNRGCRDKFATAAGLFDELIDASDANSTGARAASGAVAERMVIERRRLVGERLRLEPVRPEHREHMRRLLDCDPDIWEIYSVSGYREHFPAFWEMMLRTPDRIAYGIWDEAEGRLVGTSSMFQIDPGNRSLEIGYTFYAPECRGTHVNPEAKLLMLGHAFASGALRVQFGVDIRNARSQAAMAKFATREGILRRHKVTWTGHKRDTALFSVIDDEWPHVERLLTSRLQTR